MRNGKPMECEVALRRPSIRCAIYTRKSSEEGLQQEFNSLDAQRESAEAFIARRVSSTLRHPAWEFTDYLPSSVRRMTPAC